MTLRERAYGACVAGARTLAPVVGSLVPSLAPTLAERRTAPASMARWAREGRDAARPLVWIHGASAGELLGAAPMLREVRRRAAAQVAVTYFSPSGAPAAAALEPDYAGHPPFDTPGESLRALDALLPDAVVFAKGDVWPSLTVAAARRGVPLGLVNGTVRPGSSRLRPPVRWLLGPAYGRLGLAGAASEADADRLVALGVPRARVRVTGDAAFDLALSRADGTGPRGAEARGRLASALPPGDLTLLGGSTWPADEALLLGAAATLKERGCRVRLVIVPHRPNPEYVRALTTRCRETLGCPPLLWSELHRPPPGEPGTAAAPPGGQRAATGAPRQPGEATMPAPEPATVADVPGAAASRPLVVDTVGILADLYQAADVAYVGGGLGGSGLHSVVEPAAAGVPVLFGPRHARREAADLLVRGAAREVGERTAAQVLEELAREPARRAEMGRRARAYVEEGAGAAGAAAELVLELMGIRGPRR